MDVTGLWNHLPVKYLTEGFEQARCNHTLVRSVGISPEHDAYTACISCGKRFKSDALWPRWNVRYG